MRRRSLREASDERILGSGDFVERVIQEADENFNSYVPNSYAREFILKVRRG